jgi:hypothetical protein
VVGDGLVRDVVRGADAQRLVPGHLRAETPGGSRGQTRRRLTLGASAGLWGLTGRNTNSVLHKRL